MWTYGDVCHTSYEAIMLLRGECRSVVMLTDNTIVVNVLTFSGKSNIVLSRGGIKLPANVLLSVCSFTDFYNASFFPRWTVMIITNWLHM